MFYHVQSICDMCSVCHLLKSGVAALFSPDPRLAMFSPSVICVQCALLKSDVAALFGPEPRPAMISLSVIYVQCATC